MSRIIPTSMDSTEKHFDVFTRPAYIGIFLEVVTKAKTVTSTR